MSWNRGTVVSIYCVGRYLSNCNKSDSSNSDIGNYLLLVRPNLHVCSTDGCFTLKLLLLLLVNSFVKMLLLLQLLSSLHRCRTGGHPVGLGRGPVRGSGVEGELLELVLGLLHLLADGRVARLENVLGSLVFRGIRVLEPCPNWHVRPSTLFNMEAWRDNWRIQHI
jgi:hypothetical protein